MKTWTSHFYSFNGFCAAMEVVTQCICFFALAEKLNLQSVTFEGGSLNVIMALQGVEHNID